MPSDSLVEQLQQLQETHRQAQLAHERAKAQQETLQTQLKALEEEIRLAGFEPANLTETVAQLEQELLAEVAALQAALDGKASVTTTLTPPEVVVPARDELDTLLDSLGH